MLFSLASGASDASVVAAARDLLSPSADAVLSARDRIIIYDIRLPRVVLGVLIGAALAVSGAVMQGLFRNPLADPGLVGVSAGSSLGAVAVIVLGGTALAPLTALLGSFALPFAAFCGGLAATFMLYGISTRQGRTSVATMLLAGIALAAMAMAFTGILIFLADDRQLRDLTFWSLGSLAGATWQKVAHRRAGHRAGAVGRAVPGARAQRAVARRGDRQPSRHSRAAAEICGDRRRLGGHRHVGRGQRRHRVSSASWCRICCRLSIGPDNRYLLPASALLGASLLLIADAVSRTIVAPAELPIGIVTAAAGGPFFLWILLRKRGVLDL